MICQFCSHPAVITLAVLDYLGERVACSGCWKRLFAPEAPLIRKEKGKR